MSFLNAIFLFGLSAAVLPILIHLLSRQKARRLPFSSVEFIRRLEEKRRRRFRVTQWLLLLLRVLLLLLIALAFARPTLQSSWLGIGGGGETAAIVILDNSASMAAERGGQTRLEAGRERALAVAELIKDDDESALILASAQPSAVTGLTRSRDLLRREIAEAVVCDASSDLAGALRTAARLLADARSPNREIYVISDFQSNLIPESGLRPALPEGTRLYLLPVEPAAGGNAAVTGIGWTEDHLGSGRVRIEAEVSRFGGDGALETLVALSLDDVERERRLISLEPGEKRNVSFNVSLEGRGYHRGSVSIDSPDLGADNERPFVVGLPEGVRVLVVDGRAAGERASGYHVERALAPVAGADGFFRVTRVSAQTGGLPGLDPFGAVVLAEVNRLPSDEVNRLAAYAEGGGGVLILPGRNLDAGFYEKELLPRLQIDARLLVPPVEFEGSFARVDDIAREHPIFAPFGEYQERLLRDTKVFRYFRIQAGPEARVVASFGGGDPAIIEAERPGGGRALLWSVPADPTWTTLPRDPAFLPFLHEAVKHLTRAESPEAINLTVLAPYRRALDELPASGSVLVVPPNGSEVLLNPSDGAGGLVAEFRDTSEKGYYTLRTPNGEFPFAAALDPLESDLAALSSGELADAIPGAEIVAAQAEIRRAILSARFGREYWREILILALLLAVVELFAGRGAASAPAAQSGERRAA